jgi:Spy/CpxP family protein refolding chaperone
MVLTIFNPGVLNFFSLPASLYRTDYNTKNMTMKKIISAALALTLFVGAAQAQTNNKADRQHRGERKEMAYNKLNLTAEQKATFQRLREAQKQELQALRQSGNVTPEQRKAVHQKYKTQYEAILTPAQREEWNKQKTERKGQGDKGMGLGNRAGNPGAQAAFFKKELNLSAEQETKLTTLFQDFRSKAQDIRSNNNLSQEQKRTQVQSLAQQYMTQGKAVLTPDQAKKFEELKGKRFNRRNSNV